MNMKSKNVKHEKSIANSLNDFVEEEMERNLEQAIDLTCSNYGQIYEIIELNGDNLEGEYYLREREIFFKETLKTFNQLSFPLVGLQGV